MYLDQTLSSVLFSTIRVLLQIAAMHLLRSIVSRTYNLTYLERVDSGLLSKLRYILWTRFPTKKKHFFGRLMVLIAMIVSASLTWLPALFNKLYPVQAVYLPSRNEDYGLTYQQLKLAKLAPNSTHAPQLLSAMGIPTNDTAFSSYLVSSPSATLCTHSSADTNGGYSGYPSHLGIPMTCFGDFPVTIGSVSSAKTPVMSGNSYGSSGGFLDPAMQNITKYSPFSLSMGAPNLYVVYDTIAPISGNNTFNEDTENGIRSVESCLAYIGTGRQCVRNTLGYLIVDRKGVLIIEKKLIYQGAKAETSGQTLDCSTMATSTWKDMCNSINNSTTPDQQGYVTGLQSLENTTQGIHWNIVWKESTQIGNNAYTMMERQFGAISLEISITAYAGVPNTAELLALFNAGSFVDENCHWGQELFEATNITMSNSYQNTSEWANWGFSSQDIVNMTNFILQGSPVYGGAVILTPRDLLVDIPNFVLYIVAGVIVGLFCLGYLASLGVDGTVTRPFSEIVAATAATSSKTSHFWNRKNVANLTLRRPIPFQQGSRKTKLPPTIHVDDLQMAVEGDEIRLLNEKTEL
ncbi:hypothetical protein BGX26_000112 [Mortierella sp. AD094]|nr:hypothetical protein BGX26_000112 [Mortierella sp. AD094]